MFWTVVYIGPKPPMETLVLGPHFLNAASECNCAKVFNIISSGVNINYMDTDGHNALYEAANAGCAELVSKFLLMDIPF